MVVTTAVNASLLFHYRRSVGVSIGASTSTNAEAAAPIFLPLVLGCERQGSPIITPHHATSHHMSAVLCYAKARESTPYTWELNAMPQPTRAVPHPTRS
jgi:hypothetical protein